MKRSGFGHHPEGEEAAKPGDLAVKCPACPYPSINLPSTWQNVTPQKWYADCVVVVQCF